MSTVPKKFGSVEISQWNKVKWRLCVKINKQYFNSFIKTSCGSFPWDAISISIVIWIIWTGHLIWEVFTTFRTWCKALKTCISVLTRNEKSTGILEGWTISAKPHIVMTIKVHPAKILTSGFKSYKLNNINQDIIVETTFCICRTCTRQWRTTSPWWRRTGSSSPRPAWWSSAPAPWLWWRTLELSRSNLHNDRKSKWNPFF